MERTCVVIRLYSDYGSSQSAFNPLQLLLSVTPLDFSLNSSLPGVPRQCVQSVAV